MGARIVGSSGVRLPWFVFCWALQQLLTNHFAPQQKLVSKTRNGAKMTSP